MDETFFDLMEFLKKPTITETFVDILLCAVPIWLAVMIGLVIGWAWRPRWTSLVFLGLRSKFRFLWTAPPGFGARRLWLAFTALSAFSVCRTVFTNFIKGRSKKSTASASNSAVPLPRSSSPAARISQEGAADAVSLSSKDEEGEQDIVTENDLAHLLHLFEGKDREMEWQSMMERTTPNMSYQAWRLEPESGPAVLRSRTVFEDATPEVVRDFFWDDEFRPKWDPMLAYVKILKECPLTGTTVVHWIKKFPFFCSDREYIIGRRIWEAGRTYYCVTKGVPYPGLQKCDKPRRVELYFSSWVIRAVESRKGDGQHSACEVTLVHYEDMGIPKDVARLGLRHGMWGALKKLHSGMRAYQNARKTDTSPSRSAQMARITTKISSDEIMDSLCPILGEDEKDQTVVIRRQNDSGIDWKWIVVGGTVALAFGLHSGVIGKALLLGAGQRIARRSDDDVKKMPSPSQPTKCDRVTNGQQRTSQAYHSKASKLQFVIQRVRDSDMLLFPCRLTCSPSPRLPLSSAIGIDAWNPHADLQHTGPKLPKLALFYLTQELGHAFRKGLSPNFWILDKKLSSTWHYAVELLNDKTQKMSSNFE